MTQEELADGICTRSYLSLIEKGKVIPSPQLLAKIAERLKIHVHELEQDNEAINYKDVFTRLFESIDQMNWPEVDKIYNQLNDLYVPSFFQSHYQWVKGVMAERRQALDEAISLFENSYNLAQINEDIKMMIRALSSIGAVHLHHLAHQRVAHDYLSKALDLCLQNNISGSIKLEIVNHLGWIALRNNEKHTAIRFFKEIVQYKQAVSKHRLAAAYSGLGAAYSYLAKEDEAEYYLKSAVELLSSQGYSYPHAGSISNLAVFYRRCGRLDEALSLFEEADLLFRKAKLGKSRYGIENNKVEWAIALKEKGDCDTAIQYLMEIYENGLPMTSAEASLFLAEILLERNSVDQSIDLLSTSSAKLQEQQFGLYLFKCYTLLAQAYKKKGDLLNALDMYEKATTLYIE
jgi:HTH-type transcriptional regulator, quorum sensing regulator NprR